jgi:hypothetical protein
MKPFGDSRAKAGVGEAEQVGDGTRDRIVGDAKRADGVPGAADSLAGDCLVFRRRWPAGSGTAQPGTSAAAAWPNTSLRANILCSGIVTDELELVGRHYKLRHPGNFLHESAI